MALSLGGAVATISLDISPLEAAASRASSILSSLGSGRMGGLDNVGKSIDDVGKRIESLRSAKLDIDAAPAVSELKDVTEAVEDVETAVEKVADADIKLDMGDAKAEVQETEEAVKSLGDQMKDLESSINQVGGALSIVGGAITAAFAIATKSAISFEASMKNVQSISGSSNKELGNLEDQIMKISKVTATGPQELSEALYEVVSSGFEAEDALTVLNASAIAAKAGLTSTAVAVKGISAVLNAYQMDASEAGNVSDALFAVVDQGVVTFEELARNMGQVLPLAATLKVSIQELAAAYSLLTLRGISPAESETAIAAVMRAAINPTTQLTDAVKQYGFASAEALIQAQGFAGFLSVLQTASGGSAEALTSLLGTADATTAVLALLSNNGADYTSALEEMTAATQNGATTQKVFETQMESTAGKLQAAGAAFERLKVSVGASLAPFVGFSAQAFTGMVTVFEALPGPIQSAISLLGALGGALTLAAGAALLAVPRIIALVEAFKKLKELQSIQTATGSLTSGIGRLVGAFGPLTAVVAIVGGSLLLMHNSMERAKAQAKELEQSMIDLATAIELVRRRGDNDLADMADGLGKSLAGLPKQVQQIQQDIVATLGDPVLWRENRFNELVAQGMSPGEAVNQAMKDWQALVPAINVSSDEIVAANAKITEALSSPDVNAKGFVQWATDLIAKANELDDPTQKAIALADAVKQINAKPLSDFSTALDQTGQSAKSATDFIGNHGLGKAVEDTNKLLDDAASKARATGDAYAELYRMENGKYPDNNDQRRLNDILAERERIAKDLKAAIADGSDPELITTLTGDLEQANTEAEELIAQLSQIAALIAIGKSNSLVDSGFANVDAENAERAAERQARWAEIGAKAGEASAAASERAATAAMQATVAYEAGAVALAAQASAGEKAAAEVQRLRDAARDMLDSFHEMRGVDTFLGDWNLTSRATEASKLAENIQSTGYAIENTTRVVIGNTNAIEQQVSSLNDWATGLIGVRGEYSAMDDLLAAGRIDSGQYEAAQAAQEQIRAGYESIKVSIQDIQATAAPILGDLVEQQAAYLESLSALPPQQQLVALGWMDSATSAKAYQIYTQAAAVANGEFGASGEKMFEGVIQGAVAADPVLGALLEDMGLISIGADGTVTVHYDSAKGAKSEIAQLTESIDALIVTLGGVPPLHVDPGNLPAVKGTVDAVTGAAGNAARAIAGMGGSAGAADKLLGGVNERLSELGNQHAEPTVGVETGDADAQLQTISDLLTPLDGKEVLTRVKVLLDDQTGGGMGKYDQTGKGSAIGAVTIPVKYAAPPPLDIPTPDPVVVPVIFDSSASGGDLRSPSGIDGPFSGLGAGAITIAVTVSVTGTEQLDAVKSTIDGLANKPVSVSVAVNGAELVGALKLDIQNLSNKTVTLTVVADATSAGATYSLWSTIPDITKRFILTGDATSAGSTYSLWSTIPDVTKTLFMVGDASNAGEAYTAISTLPDVTKAFTMTGDSSEAGAAYTAISTLPDVTKALTITGDNSAAMGAYNELSGLANITKTMTINIVTNGSVPALAKGGYVPGVGPTATIARMGERGPELYRTPQGRWGLARTDGLYPMIPGSYVYTASRTRNMLRRWDGPAYARGGRVATPTASAQRGTSSTSSTMIHVAPNVTIHPQSTLSDSEMDHITEQVSGAIVTAVQTRRFAKGGQ